MHFGIDLGTTNSLIAVFRNGAPELVPNALGQVLTPSAVALHEDRLVVGEAARSIAQADPARAALLFKLPWGPSGAIASAATTIARRNFPRWSSRR